MRIKRFLGIGAMAMFVVSACTSGASPAPSSQASQPAGESQAPASAAGRSPDAHRVADERFGQRRPDR